RKRTHLEDDTVRRQRTWREAIRGPPRDRQWLGNHLGCAADDRLSCSVTSLLYAEGLTMEQEHDGAVRLAPELGRLFIQSTDVGQHDELRVALWHEFDGHSGRRSEQLVTVSVYANGLRRLVLANVTGPHLAV